MSDERESKFNPTQALFLSIAYAFGCYFLMPHGWEVCGEVAFFLFGALLVAPTGIGKFISAILLLSAITVSHRFVTDPNYSFFSLKSDSPDTIVYIAEFLAATVLAIVIVFVDVFRKDWKLKWDNAFVWTLGYFFVLLLIVPQDVRYKFAFGFNWPFVITAYKCKTPLFRLISLGCILLSSAIIYRILSQHDNVMRMQFTMYGVGIIAFFAWFVYLGYKSFGEQKSA